MTREVTTQLGSSGRVSEDRTVDDDWPVKTVYFILDELKKLFNIRSVI